MRNWSIPFVCVLRNSIRTGKQTKNWEGNKEEDQFVLPNKQICLHSFFNSSHRISLVRKQKLASASRCTQFVQGNGLVLMNVPTSALSGLPTTSNGFGVCAVCGVFNP